MYTFSVCSLLVLLAVDLTSSCLFPSPTPSPPAPAPSPPTSGTCQCGQSRQLVSKIVNGDQTKANEFPWQVALVNKGRSSPFCGGTLLSSKTVLTAAHCYKNPNDIQVVLGEHNTNYQDSKDEVFSVSSFRKHPQYSPTTTDYDFAIITLTKDVTFTDAIEPVCLPNSGTKVEGVTATVSGWGTLFSGGYQSTTLNKVDVKTMPNLQCTSSAYAYTRDQVTSNMICATAPGKDSCQGDSGGPLVTKGSGGFYSIIGVVSWGYGCAQADAPGVYSRVTAQLPWIKGQIQGSRCP